MEIKGTEAREGGAFTLLYVCAGRTLNPVTFLSSPVFSDSQNPDGTEQAWWRTLEIPVLEAEAGGLPHFQSAWDTQ